MFIGLTDIFSLENFNNLHAPLWNLITIKYKCNIVNNSQRTCVSNMSCSNDVYGVLFLLWSASDFFWTIKFVKCSHEKGVCWWWLLPPNIILHTSSFMSHHHHDHRHHNKTCMSTTTAATTSINIKVTVGFVWRKGEQAYKKTYTSLWLRFFSFVSKYYY